MPGIPRSTFALLAVALSVGLANAVYGDDPAAKPVDFAREIRPIFEQHCVKCHGAKRSEAGLRLDGRAEALAGGDDGPVIAPGKAAASRLLDRVSGTSDDSRMPPEDEGPPLEPAAVALLRAWIDQGAKWAEDAADGDGGPIASDHWAFQPLRRPDVSKAHADHTDDSPIDAFISDKLAAHKLAMSPETSRPALIRRLSLDLLGLPPTAAEVDAFVRDERPDAYQRLVDRLLASPHYGERMGRHWLDVVGYSDSNGYHRNDTPRPLAWRYRDYVIKSVNDDKPYDRLWLEQLAGDELVGNRDASHLTPEAIDCLVATHFLRNGPDGTDSTEGNEIARTIERYAVLEQQQQITISAMFALTIDCARCHSHKFDPIPQRDYYALQAVFYPAFNVKKWVQPKDRTMSVASPQERTQWQAQVAAVDAELAAIRKEHAAWRRANRQKGTVLFSDDFETASLAPRWSNTAPGDDTPAAAPGVHVDSTEAPAAHVKDGALAIVEAGSATDGWLCTTERFDWTPDNAGQWIQVTFDLVDVKVDPAGSPAERVGYYIALHDYNDNGPVAGGDILIDGNPAGGAEAHVDYPGANAHEAGKIGASPYVAGRNYGVRVTNVDGKYRLQQIVDGAPEEKALVLTAEDLPDGGIGFEYCCGRSFVVDNVLVETGDAKADDPDEIARRDRVHQKQTEFEAAVKKKQAERPQEPGLVAWVTDLSPEPPAVHLLKRGSYFNPGPEVAPAALSVLSGGEEGVDGTPPDAAATTGRRLAFARWATRKGSKAAALLARVQANRMWMWRFGRGIVDTPENFGTKGAAPSHPELLEYLAAELVDHNWSLKRLDRQILLSGAYRQSSGENAAAIEADPENRYLWRYPPHRLDSETVRDSMLAVAGTINLTAGGPPIDYTNDGEGQIVVSAKTAGAPDAANRRSIYIRQRRSEPVTFLSVFDQATAEPNCLRRSAATVVSQSLALLNSDFAVSTADAFATRIEREAPAALQDRVSHAFRIAFARPPTGSESKRVVAFLRAQAELHRSAGVAGEQAAHAALANFCQMLLAANEFIYTH